MYAKMSETLILPWEFSSDFAVARLLRDRGVSIVSVDLNGEAVYTVAGSVLGAIVIGYGFLPEEEDRFPAGVMLVLHAGPFYKYRLDLHHWSSDDFHKKGS